MSSDDIAISVRSLTKTYRLFGHPGDRIKQFLSFGLKQYHSEFNALKDVSRHINRGVLLITGRNGSGKSTLLQLISGILKPTKGRVSTQGRISALLELGSGSNPEFTGRENVLLSGRHHGPQRVADGSSVSPTLLPSPTSVSSSTSRYGRIQAVCLCGSRSPWRSASIPTSWSWMSAPGWRWKVSAQVRRLAPAVTPETGDRPAGIS